MFIVLIMTDKHEYKKKKKKTHVIPFELSDLTFNIIIIFF